jgi:hypothetical protein
MRLPISGPLIQPLLPYNSARARKGRIACLPARGPRDAGKIAQEIVAHLAGLKDADVKVEIHSEATIPEGVDPSLVRVVTESCKVLKFRGYGFER